MNAVYSPKEHELRNAARVLASLADRLQGEESADQAIHRIRSEKLSALERAEDYYRLRREREKHFGGNIFGEPAWDLLLDLFIQGERNKQVSISSACLAAAVPATTALRWIDHLVNEGHVVRVPDATDGRRIFVQLTPAARRDMYSFFESAA